MCVPDTPPPLSLSGLSLVHDSTFLCIVLHCLTQKQEVWDWRLLFADQRGSESLTNETSKFLQMHLKKDSCPERPDGVQVLGWSQLIFGNSFTSCRPKRSSSQQLQHTNPEQFMKWWTLLPSLLFSVLLCGAPKIGCHLLLSDLQLFHSGVTTLS